MALKERGNYRGDIGDRELFQGSSPRTWLIYGLLLCCLTGCTQTLEFDVLVVESVDLDLMFAANIAAGERVITLPDGVQSEDIPIDFEEVIDLYELDSSLQDLIDSGAELSLLSADYRVVENSSSILFPSVTLSVSTDSSDVRGVAEIPGVGAGEQFEWIEFPWVDGGIELLEAALKEVRFSTHLSGLFILPEGVPIPSGRIQLEIMIRGMATL